MTSSENIKKEKSKKENSVEDLVNQLLSFIAKKFSFSQGQILHRFIEPY